jgi:hypothetical protein
MENLIAGDLKIELVDSQSGSMKLMWRGKSNDRQPGKILHPYFRDVLERAATQKVPIELHFESLEHFNSSTITALIQFIQETKSKGIKLSISYSAALKWQKLSFDALRVFTKDNALLEFHAV